jgi:hypothetical protein
VPINYNPSAEYLNTLIHFGNAIFQCEIPSAQAIADHFLNNELVCITKIHCRANQSYMPNEMVSYHTRNKSINKLFTRSVTRAIKSVVKIKWIVCFHHLFAVHFSSIHFKQLYKVP